MALADTAKLIASLSLKDGFTGPLKTMDHALSSFDKHVTQSQTRAYKAGQQIGHGIQNGAKLAAAAITGLAVAGSALVISGIRSASDLSETVSKVGVVFKQNAAQVVAFGQTSATALGLSENAALSAAATYGNLFVSMGLTADKSKDMSLALVKLASDLASFNNIDPTEAAEKLRAGITGESEPLKTLGININETIIKQRALELGLVKLGKGQKAYTGVLPAAARAQAAYSLILEQSKTAQGDFGRTQSGLANQTRILQANWEDLKATLGTPVLPKVAKILQRINALIRDNIPFVSRLGDKVADLFSDDNLTKGEAALSGIFDTVKSFLPAIQSAAEITGRVVTTSVDAFKSLPKEIQSLAIAGLAVNKLTGGLVTNIAGGLISAVISSFKGLMNVNAAVVNVNGPAGVGGAAAGAAGIGLGTLGIVAAAGVAAAFAFINTHQGPGSTGAFTPTIGAGFDQKPVDASGFGRVNWAKVASDLKIAAADRQRDATDRNMVEDRTHDAIENLRGDISRGLNVDVANADAIGRAVAQENGRAIINADRAARGLKGPFRQSTSIKPRLDFLAGNASDSKDVAVAAAITRAFENVAHHGPIFKSDKALGQSIKALQKDQKTLGPKAAAKVGGYIDRLKAELARREGAVKAAIDKKNLAVTVNNTFKASTYINGRLLDATTNRFKSTIVGHKGTFAEFG